MKLIMDDILDDEIKEYLLSQEGISSVDIKVKDFTSEVIVKYDSNITPLIIMKYIELYNDNDYSSLLEFDKDLSGNYKTLKYIIDDICCDYCYKGFVMDLFENNNIKSVKSNYNFNNPLFNIEFTIEYNESYEEDKLIKYIKEKI